MNDETKTLSRKAQALSPNERVALVEDVLDSLDKLDPAVEQLWAKGQQTGLLLIAGASCPQKI
jgi:hypothetical protein